MDSRLYKKHIKDKGFCGLFANEAIPAGTRILTEAAPLLEIETTDGDGDEVIAKKVHDAYNKLSAKKQDYINPTFSLWQTCQRWPR